MQEFEVSSQRFFPFDETLAVRLEGDFAGLFDGSAADAEKAAETARRLIGKYSEKHRHYHNLSHVNALLAGVDRFAGSISDEKTLRLAVWFHDAVYDPQRVDNEAASARLAEEMLPTPGVAAAAVEKAAAIICATERHAGDGLDEDGRLFLDLDLAILGSEENVYRKYALAIRAEYAFVAETIYRQKRAEILRRFLARENLYFTPDLREIFEERARRNVANEIKELS